MATKLLQYPGFQLMTDDDICEHCTSEEAFKSEDTEEIKESCPVTHSMAAHV